MRLGSNIGHQLSLSIFLFVGVKVSHKHSHFSLFIYFYSISLFPYLPISLCNCFLCFSPLSFFDIRFSTSLSFVIINLCHSLYLLYTLSLSLSTYFCLSPSVWNCISLPLLPLSLFISLSPSLSLFLSIYVPLSFFLFLFIFLIDFLQIISMLLFSVSLWFFEQKVQAMFVEGLTWNFIFESY